MRNDMAKVIVKRPRHRLATDDRVSLTPDREFRRLNGLWFEVRLAGSPISSALSNQPKARFMAMFAHALAQTLGCK